MTFRRRVIMSLMYSCLTFHVQVHVFAIHVSCFGTDVFMKLCHVSFHSPCHVMSHVSRSCHVSSAHALCLMPEYLCFHVITSFHVSCFMLRFLHIRVFKPCPAMFLTMTHHSRTNDPKGEIL